MNDLQLNVNSKDVTIKYKKQTFNVPHCIFNVLKKEVKIINNTGYVLFITLKLQKVIRKDIAAVREYHKKHKKR